MASRQHQYSVARVYISFTPTAYILQYSNMASDMQQDAAAAANATAPMPDIRAPPSGVRFGSLLPLGVKGKAITRKFYPNNGTTFQVGGG